MSLTASASGNGIQLEVHSLSTGTQTQMSPDLHAGRANDRVQSQGQGGVQSEFWSIPVRYVKFVVENQLETGCVKIATRIRLEER